MSNESNQSITWENCPTRPWVGCKPYDPKADKRPYGESVKGGETRKKSARQ